MKTDRKFFSSNHYLKINSVAKVRIVFVYI